MKGMICPHCGKLAYWYELKTKGEQTIVRACCKKALE